MMGGGFSDSSGIEWHANGGFGLGVEFAGNGTADWTQDILDPNLNPVFPTQLTFTGTFSCRPRTPSHGTFGSQTDYINASLARIWILGEGDPLSIFNQNTTEIAEAANLEIPQQVWFFPPRPPDGSPFRIRVMIGLSGAAPADAEIELVGQWK